MSNTTPNKSGPLLSDTLYNRLKFSQLIAIPAVSAFYFAFAQIWGLPKAEETVGTLAILSVLIGALLTKSTSDYGKSDANVAAYLTETGRNEDTGIPDLKLTVTKDPRELANLDHVRIKIGEPPAPPKVDFDPEDLPEH